MRSPQIGVDRNGDCAKGRGEARRDVWDAKEGKLLCRGEGINKGIAVAKKMLATTAQQLCPAPVMVCKRAWVRSTAAALLAESGCGV